ncbi:MAG: hypothetical protein JW794_02620, partial [Candidatus Cloacimonetes bacterium]|nr:hypothetical protein [Candidatus Cloacimonadota bacterium]
ETIITNFEFHGQDEDGTIRRFYDTTYVYPDYCFYKQAATIIASYYQSRMYLCDIKTEITYNVTPFFNDMIISNEEVQSEITCINTEKGLPYTLPFKLE